MRGTRSLKTLQWKPKLLSEILSREAALQRLETALPSLFPSSSDEEIAEITNNEIEDVKRARLRLRLLRESPDHSNDKARLHAYNIHFSDSEAAKALGVTQWCFRSWRQQNNLPARGFFKPAKRKLNEKTAAEIREKFLRGRNIMSLALENNMSEMSMHRIIKGKRWKPKTKADEEKEFKERESRLQAYDASISDGDAAQKLGISREAFWWWRHKHGIPAFPSRKFSPRQVEEIRTKYLAGRTLRRLAQDYNTSEATIFKIKGGKGVSRGHG